MKLGKLRIEIQKKKGKQQETLQKQAALEEKTCVAVVDDEKNPELFACDWCGELFESVISPKTKGMN